MAKATRHEAVVETKVVEIEPEWVTLELTIQEARVLRMVVGRLRGGRESGSRDATRAIFAALNKAGVPPGGDSFTGHFEAPEW